MSKQKLELTWIGKNNPEYDIANIEPRILEENPDLSCGDHNTENMIIHGDNLLALKALLPEYEGKIKCIYIDPPFNTGAAFEHYDDCVEHSTWLSLMKTRFELLCLLLNKSGILLLHLDDEEIAYARVLLDEVFGRNNYLNTISLSTNDPSGFKATASTIFSTANYILIYAKDKSSAQIKKIYIEKEYDSGYSKVLLNKDDPIEKWVWEDINSIIAKELSYSTPKEAKKKLRSGFRDYVAEYAAKNADRVFQLVAIGGGAKLKRQETINVSKNIRDKVFVHPGEDINEFYILNGRQMVFYHNRLREINGSLVPSQLITDVWTDISWNGIASEGGVDFKNGKKPEKLIMRCLELCTEVDDMVLDSFLGSGTTSAVAHKMRRKYIGIEMGEHAYTHVHKRMKAVVDGTDQSGISKVVGWKSGGGFKFYELAPSFVAIDEFGNPVIDSHYNDTKLIRAMCKLMNYTFAPSPSDYWQHGKGQGNNSIYVTTQMLSVAMVQQMTSHLRVNETLLICPKKYEPGCEKVVTRITIKKIPQSILKACQFGKKEYLLPIKERAIEEIDEEEVTDDEE